MIQNILDKIENTIKCYEASRTEENKESVDGIIYGMEIALATIKGEIKYGKHT